MITLYVQNRSEGCNNARKWFQDNNIPFKERNIITDPLTYDEFIKILYLTDNGTEDIISKRTDVVKTIDIEQLQLKDFYDLIRKKPRLLLKPIIHDNKRLLAGFDKYQIRMFLPKSLRLVQLHEAQDRMN